MFLFLTFVLLVGLGALWGAKHKGGLPVPGLVFPVIGGLSALTLFMGLFNQMFFYADPGYQYHVRTIFGTERVVDGVTDTGYNLYMFGWATPWKKALTIQAVDRDEAGGVESDSSASASLPSQNLVFLDQVDANVEATVRFRLPDDDQSFLKMAREYRTQENLLVTSLVPAFRETLQATASLMNAEEYYTGGRNSFNRDFEDQMQSGIFVVRRIETERTTLPSERARSTANASLGAAQQTGDDEQQVVTAVERVTGADGQLLRKDQAFTNWGIQVIEARITDVDPNAAYKTRMERRQQASADRSIAREQRTQEEEQRLLVIAKGDREVAERQAAARVEQIAQTTGAETAKQLAITQANQRKEQADIDRATAEIRLAQAKTDAQARTVAADAAAYEKRKLIEADDALAAKLEAWQKINEVWANAAKTAPVPGVVMGGNGEGSRMSSFEQMMGVWAAQSAKQLQLDPSINRQTAPQR